MAPAMSSNRNQSKNENATDFTDFKKLSVKSVAFFDFHLELKNVMLFAIASVEPFRDSCSPWALKS
jgi:hypothetical protein